MTPTGRGSAPTRARVPVVDDDRHITEALATFLERAGFDVGTAADAVEALRVALHGFDVIATDFDMPLMDGHESSNGFAICPSGQRPS